MKVYDNSNVRVRDFFNGIDIEDVTVTIIGLGGGGEIVLKLLQSGVSRFNLVDFDTLEVGNLVRHVCGAKYIGMNKADAVKKLLEEYSGTTNNDDIVAYDFDILDCENYSKISDIIKQSTVVICATDTDASKYLVNELCVENKVPCVFVGMFKNGCGGIIHLYDTENACLVCMDFYGDKTDFFHKYNTTVDKKDCASDREVKSMPGLGIDQSFLASISARKVLETIMKIKGNDSFPECSENWTIFSIFGIGQLLPEKLSCISKHQARNQECPYCNNLFWLLWFSIKKKPRASARGFFIWTMNFKVSSGCLWWTDWAELHLESAELQSSLSKNSFWMLR